MWLFTDFRNFRTTLIHAYFSRKDLFFEFYVFDTTWFVTSIQEFVFNILAWIVNFFLTLFVFK